MPTQFALLNGSQTTNRNRSIWHAVAELSRHKNRTLNALTQSLNKPCLTRLTFEAQKPTQHHGPDSIELPCLAPLVPATQHPLRTLINVL
jgi:hypothetical protein